MTNVYWFQLLKCEDLLLSSVLYVSYQHTYSSELCQKLGEHLPGVNVKCFDLSSGPAVSVFECKIAGKSMGSSGGHPLKNWCFVELDSRH